MAYLKMQQAKYSREKISWKKLKFWKMLLKCHFWWKFQCFQRTNIKLHASAGWDCEMLKMPNLWYCNSKKVFCFNCNYWHFSHWNELFLRNFDKWEPVRLYINSNYHLKRKLMDIPTISQRIISLSIYEHKMEQDLMNHWLVILFH